MSKAKYKPLLALVLISGSLTGGYTLAEVRHVQLNELNLMVEVENDNWQPSSGNWENGLSIQAGRTGHGRIILDGKGTEKNWNNAPEIAVPMFYGNVDTAYVQALYNDDDVFIKVRWRDDTENREHHPWVWDKASKQFVEGPQVEDSLILSFEAYCEWTPSFLSGYSFDFDGWQWLAARTDPLGQAVDIEGNVQIGYVRKPPYVPYQSRINEDTWNVKFTDYNEGILHSRWYDLDRIYLLQPVDGKETSSYRAWPDGNIIREKTKVVEHQPPPQATYYNKIKKHPRFKPAKIEGDAGEVKAKGRWEDGYWTVEFQRARIAPIGRDDDMAFVRMTQFSIHVFDQTERIDESSESGRLFLEFME